MKFFNAVAKAKFVGDGTVGELVDWLERLINVLFPENGIEYWSDQRHNGVNSLKRFQKVPGNGCSDEDVHHPYCYVRQGGCEGRIIEVGFCLRNDTYKSLTWIKTFGSEDESYLIARAISHVLDSIWGYEEVPEIVEMANKMPREQRWRRETSLQGEVSVIVTPYSLTVKTDTGTELDNRSWTGEGDNAKFYVESRWKDWVTVLTNMKATFKVVQENSGLTYYRLMLTEFPGDPVLDQTPLLFECWADDRQHADEQAVNAYPRCKVLGLEGENHAS